MDEQQKPAQTEISEELRTLGQRLREAAKTAQESPQAQDFRRELERGLSELREEIDELRSSEEAQRLEESVRDVGGDVTQTVRKGVLAALRELNTRIARVVEEAEEGAPAEGTPPEESA